jgi:nitric oxide synthase-interacting protein
MRIADSPSSHVQLRQNHAALIQGVCQGFLCMVYLFLSVLEPDLCVSNIAIRASPSCICLKDCDDPLACPEGHLFCKSCIYENLLAQKQEIKQRLKSYELQELQEQNTAQEQALLADQAKLDKFFETEHGILPQDRVGLRPGAAAAAAAAAASAPASAATTAATTTPLLLTHAGSSAAADPAVVVIPKQTGAASAVLRHADGSVASAAEAAEAKSKHLPCFWIPSLAPELTATKLTKPDEHTYCPERRHILRVKQLQPVHWTLIEDMSERDPRGVRGGNQNRNMCPSCRKTLNNMTRMTHLR